MRRKNRAGLFFGGKVDPEDKIAELDRLYELAEYLESSRTVSQKDKQCEVHAYHMGDGKCTCSPAKKFKLGDAVRKSKGSQWHGRVVGEYSTALTPEGYAVESSAERGSVQIYPAAALEFDT